MHLRIISAFPDIAAVWVRFDSSHWVIQKGAQVLKFKPRCKLKSECLQEKDFGSSFLLFNISGVFYSVDSGKTAFISCTTLFC